MAGHRGAVVTLHPLPPLDAQGADDDPRRAEALTVVLPSRPSRGTAGRLLAGLFLGQRAVVLGEEDLLPALSSRRHDRSRGARPRVPPDSPSPTPVAAAASASSASSASPYSTATLTLRGPLPSPRVRNIWPSHAWLQQAGSGAVLCRCALGFDPRRPEHALMVKNGQLLALREFDPHEMIAQRLKEIDMIIYAKAAAKVQGGGAGRVPHKRKTRKQGGGGGTTHRRGRARGHAGGRTSGDDDDDDDDENDEGPTPGEEVEDNEYDEDDLLNLLCSVRASFYMVRLQWMVGGRQLAVGPVSAAHAVCDLLTAVADAAALEPALIRLTWRGNILPLGQRLGPLGIKQYVTDPVFVTVLDEPTAAAAAAPGDTFGGAARAQVRVVRNT